MTVAAIVPARMASSRLPGKPLADIGGKPMIVRTLTRAAEAADIVLAAVDSPQLAEVVRAAGFDVCLTGECDSGSARAAAAAAERELDDNIIAVNIQGDEPFVEPSLIKDTAALLSARPDCVCATAMRPPRNADEFADPSAVKVVADSGGAARYFSRAPIPFCRDNASGKPPAAARIHLGIYAYRMPFLRQLPALSPSPLEQLENLEQLRPLWHGFSIALLDAESESFGVDTPADLEEARKRAAADSKLG